MEIKTFIWNKNVIGQVDFYICRRVYDIGSVYYITNKDEMVTYYKNNKGVGYLNKNVSGRLIKRFESTFV